MKGVYEMGNTAVQLINAMRIALILLITLCVITGCRSIEDVTPEPNVETGLLKDRSINLTDSTRQYHLYVPETFTEAPLVLLFHGNGGSSDELLGESKLIDIKAPYKRWLDVAERENLILAIPQGSLGSNGKQGWNDCRADAEGNPSSDDVLFITELINHISDTYLEEPAEVFALGTSNGGHMVLRLAQEMPEELSAVAVIAAANPVNTKCAAATTPLSVLIMNGTNDPLLPFDGGQIGSNRGEVSSAEATTSYWVNRNQTETTPTITELPDANSDDASTISKELYQNGNNNTKVALYKITNGGHTEPSISERYSTLYKRIVGEQNGDIEMAEEIWTFFSTLSNDP